MPEPSADRPEGVPEPVASSGDGESVAVDDPVSRTISRIHISNFRAIRDMDLELRPLTVMVGANGSGKTTLLQALSIVSSAARGTLPEMIVGMGGLSQIQNQIDRADITFEVFLPRTEGHYATYCFALLAVGYGGFRVDGERMRAAGPELAPIDLIMVTEEGNRYYDFEKEQLVKPEVIPTDAFTRVALKSGRPLYEDFLSGGVRNSAVPVIRETQTALSQTPIVFELIRRLKDELESVRYFCPIDVRPQAPIRQPQVLRPESLPGENGEDLVSCLYTMRESAPESFSAVLEVVRSAFPKFERLEFPLLGQGVVGLLWKEQGQSQGFGMNQLADGALRFLWLVSLLYSPGLPMLTLIDEPEVGLHPELLAILTDVLRDATLRSQVIVATHSDRLIRHLKPSEVLTMDLDEENLPRARWADSMDLDHWMQDYTLDQLWSMGIIGGRS